MDYGRVSECSTGVHAIERRRSDSCGNHLPPGSRPHHSISYLSYLHCHTLILLSAVNMDETPSVSSPIPLLSIHRMHTHERRNRLRGPFPTKRLDFTFFFAMPTISFEDAIEDLKSMFPDYDEVTLTNAIKQYRSPFCRL